MMQPATNAPTAPSTGAAAGQITCATCGKAVAFGPSRPCGTICDAPLIANLRATLTGEGKAS